MIAVLSTGSIPKILKSGVKAGEDKATSRISYHYKKVRRFNAWEMIFR